jgi:predicted permease
MSRADQQLHDEFEHHLRLRAEELERAGIPPTEALRQARLEFGPIESLKEECREQRPANWLFDLGRDMRHTLRMLRRSPVLAAAAVLSLGLGIGGNTAIFTLIDSLLLSELPVERPSELYAVKWKAEKDPPMRMANGAVDKAPLGESGSIGNPFSYPAYERLRDQMTLAGFQNAQLANVNATGHAESTSVQAVSSNYHSLLGVPPYRGRLLRLTDDQPGAPAVAIASYRYWKNQLASDPLAIGRTIRINSHAVELVGVTPPSFYGHEVGAYPDLTVPLRQVPLLGGALREKDQPFTNADFWWVKLIARLPNAASPTDRQNAALLASLSTAPSDPQSTPTLRFEPAAASLSEIRRQFSEPLQVLMGMMVLVLFIASANVANLLLARAVARDKEILVRLSLGASPGRLMRQFLAEFLVLALLGSILAVVFANGLVGLLIPLLPGREEIQLLDGGAPNVRILAFTASVALLVTLLFGIWPARQAATRQLQPGLPQRKTRLTGALLVSQVAIATVLIVGAGLFAATLRNLYRTEYGFDKQRLLLFTVDALQAGTKPTDAYPFYREFQRRLEALPGVTLASASFIRPMGGGGWWDTCRVPGNPKPVPYAVHPSLPNYPETLALQLRAGRLLVEADQKAPIQRVVINQSLARKLFGTEDAVGRTFQQGWRDSGPLTEVVGVVADARYEHVRGDWTPTAYRLLVPDKEFEYGELNYVIRTAVDPTTLATAIRALNPNLPLVDLRTMDQQVDTLLRQERLFALLCGGFALLALLLASLGLFGVLSYRVNRRQTELGIRLALGAPRFALWRMVVAEGWRWVAAGAVLGLLGAAQLTKLVQSYLYGLEAADPSNWLAPLGLLLASAAVAVALPAWRACRLDPMTALRRE